MIRMLQIRKLAIAVFLALMFMVVEIIGGIIAGSLAIITDAAHLLADVSGFGVSLVAIFYASRRSHSHFSFGYHRVEVLAALASVLTVWLVTGILVWEAIQRIVQPQPINGKVMTILALIGVGVNLALMMVLGGHSHGDHGHEHHHHDHHLDDAEHGERSSHDGHGHSDLNLRGAVVHVIGDLVQSIGVAIAGGLIWYNHGNPAYYIADPICTMLFAILVLYTTSGILRNVSDVLMERVPRWINPDSIADAFTSLPGVVSIHDLHIWCLTNGIPLLAVHVDVEDGVEPQNIFEELKEIASKYGIQHTTFQVDKGPCPSNGASIIDP